MNDSGVLEKFTVVIGWRTDLVCDSCGSVASIVEDGSSVANLASAADQHWRENHARA